MSADLPKTTVGMDQFIGDVQNIGKGHGTLFIKEFITKQLQMFGITTVIVDTYPENAAAIRCYEKVGFKRLGIYQAPLGRTFLMKFTIDRWTSIN